MASFGSRHTMKSEEVERRARVPGVGDDGRVKTEHEAGGTTLRQV